MESSGDTGSPETLEELVEETRGPREAIVNGLRFYGGEAHSKKLRQHDEIPSKNYHFEKLKEQGLVEQTGEQPVGKGGTAKEYRLTNTGQDVAEALAESSGVTGTITDVMEQLEKQRESIEELQDAHNEMAEFVETLQDQIDDSDSG
jgi:predicted transcriptional regulator